MPAEDVGSQLSDAQQGFVLRDSEPPSSRAARLEAEEASRSILAIPQTSPRMYGLLHLQWHIARLSDWLFAQLRIEQAERGAFLWSPVCLGFGSGCYFILPQEPWFYAFPLATLLSAILVFRSTRGSVSFNIPFGVALVCCGISLAQFRTQLLATTALGETTVAQVTGQVQRIERRANGRVRYTIDITDGLDSLTGRTDAPTSIRARITARAHTRALTAGDMIHGRARLGPPPGPAVPGGFDFGFYSWFQGIGASGFFLGHPQLLSTQAHQSPGISRWIAGLRETISGQLRKALPERASALASALIIGERGAVDAATNNALRRSGLAHILAISGLHMALVSLTVVGFVRLVLAFFPHLVVQYPVKKWANCFGLLFATVYLLLSGASLSTQRAYIMISILLFAGLIDRKALTMRNVALAALCVLVLTPEAVLHPGFQMSFAATAALIGAYELIAKIKTSQNRPVPVGRWSSIVHQSRRYLQGLILVPLIAGMATALFAAYHFYRVAPLGLLANMLAMPVVSIAVMPLALISVVLMPFGLEQWALSPFGLSLELVVDIAHWVAELDGSGATGRLPLATMAWGTMALLVATLCRSGLKWLAVPLMIAALANLIGIQRPDLVIAESGRQIGMIHSNGEMVLLKPRAEKFTTNIWKQAYAINIFADAGVLSGQRTPQCDRFGCVLRKSGWVIAHVANTGRINQDCLQADILIVPYSTPWACRFLPQALRPLLIDRTELRRRGAHEIYIMGPRRRQNSNSPLYEADVTRSDLNVKTACNPKNRPWEIKIN